MTKRLFALSLWILGLGWLLGGCNLRPSMHVDVWLYTGGHWVAKIEIRYKHINLPKIGNRLREFITEAGMRLIAELSYILGTEPEWECERLFVHERCLLSLEGSSYEQLEILDFRVRPTPRQDWLRVEYQFRVPPIFEEKSYMLAAAPVDFEVCLHAKEVHPRAQRCWPGFRAVKLEARPLSYAPHWITLRQWWWFAEREIKFALGILLVIGGLVYAFSVVRRRRREAWDEIDNDDYAYYAYLEEDESDYDYDDYL